MPATPAPYSVLLDDSVPRHCSFVKYSSNVFAIAVGDKLVDLLQHHVELVHRPGRRRFALQLLAVPHDVGLRGRWALYDSKPNSDRPSNDRKAKDDCHGDDLFDW